MRTTAEESCPPWCVADHELEDEARRLHRAATRTMPAIVPVAERASARELLIELWSLDDDPEIWVYIGDGVDARLELTLESARRLHGELHSLLERSEPIG